MRDRRSLAQDDRIFERAPDYVQALAAGSGESAVLELDVLADAATEVEQLVAVRLAELGMIDVVERAVDELHRRRGIVPGSKEIDARAVDVAALEAHMGFE